MDVNAGRIFVMRLLLCVWMDFTFGWTLAPAEVVGATPDVTLLMLMECTNFGEI